jgi:hypothetical protein
MVVYFMLTSVIVLSLVGVFITACTPKNIDVDIDATYYKSLKN